MAAPRYDLEVEKGATWIQAFRYTDDSGIGIDLTGYEIRMQVRPTHEDVVIPGFDLSSVGSPAGIVQRVDAGGELSMFEATVAADDTAAVVGCNAVYDIEIESPDGIVTRILQGRVRFSPEVTRQGSP